MNYFDNEAAAKKYAAGRPDFHAGSIRRIKDFLKLDAKLDKALDIACGTGLSTRALLALAENVFGTDSSESMLGYALQADRIQYSLASAERQPFPDNEFDLITVCSGVHWFDIDKFLFESSRLLTSASWLVLYDNFFLGELDGDENFRDWYTKIYLKRFPPPPRNDRYEWSEQYLGAVNLNLIHEENFKNPVAFSKARLIRYLITQSNVIAQLESRETSSGATEIWLDKELTEFFEGRQSTRTLYFGNWIRYIQKVS